MLAISKPRSKRAFHHSTTADGGTNILRKEGDPVAKRDFKGLEIALPEFRGQMF
jgi:hypothetical protein